MARSGAAAGVAEANNPPLVHAHGDSTPARRMPVRLLGLVPAALMLTGLLAVSSVPLTAPASAAMPTGTVVSWGLDDQMMPETPPAGLTGVIAIAAGDSDSLALKSDGTVVVWGSVAFPVPAGLTGVTAISAGATFNLALKSDDTVVAWGEDDSGQTDVPPGLSGVIAIAAGFEQALALKTDGTVVAWGYNGQGQTDVPAGLSGVTAIAAGWDMCLALRSDGTVVVWGANGVGQIDVPPDLTGVIAISAGHDHSLALKADGTVVAWGDNSGAQSDVPAGLSDITAISAGGYHSLVLESDGTVVAWGATNASPAPKGVIAISAGSFYDLALVPTVVATASPVVSSLDPPSGSFGGGQTITVHGSGLTGATSVSFDKTSGTEVHVVTDTSLTVKVPALPAKPDAYKIHVQVSTPTGESAATTNNLYEVRGVAVFIVRGMMSSYPTADAFEQSDGLIARLGGKGIPRSAFVEYSYNGGSFTDSKDGPVWTPNSYTCGDSIRSISRDAIPSLDNQVRTYVGRHSDIDIYLVGHSQGGVVAFGYLAYLEHTHHSLTDITTKDSKEVGARLAGVVTLDSPIGGIDPSIGQDALGLGADLNCRGKSLTEALRTQEAEDTADFAAIAASDWDSSTPRGGRASISLALFDDPSIGPSDQFTFSSNDQLAAAAAAAGIRVLTVGNTKDDFFDMGSLPGNPYQLSTQWLTDKSKASSPVYARAITDADPKLSWLSIVGYLGLNHLRVLISSEAADYVGDLITGQALPSTHLPPTVAVPRAAPALALAAPAAPKGGISGTVTGGGVALPGLDVAALPLAGATVVTTTTDSSGAYKLPLGPGTYVVLVRDPSGAYPTGFAATSGFTTDLSAATQVTVGTTMSPVQVSLPAGHRLAGTVRDSGGKPLAGARIEVDATTGTFVASGVAGSDGSYSITVPAGTYVVRATDYSGAHASGYYAGATLSATPAGAKSITLTSGDSVAVEFALPGTVSLAGTVTGAGPAPLAAILVTATNRGSGEIAYAYTGTDGTYSMTLGPGTYQVSFSDPAALHVSGYYGSGGFTALAADAQPVSVGAADVRGIDVQMLAASASGATTGPPIPIVLVGLGVIGLAAILIVGVLLAVWRRRRAQT